MKLNITIDVILVDVSVYIPTLENLVHLRVRTISSSSYFFFFCVSFYSHFFPYFELLPKQILIPSDRFIFFNRKDNLKSNRDLF